VNVAAPFDGGVYIADTSAWNRADRLPSDIKDDWDRALVNDQIAACAPVTLELLYSTQSASDFDVWANNLQALRRVATIDQAAYRAVVEAYREIAHQGSHRGVPFPDLLIAAAATAHHWGVLHYDSHFDLLAGLQDFVFESRWIAPAGSIP
jgi:predicted nucleic acid-binding protein